MARQKKLTKDQVLDHVIAHQLQMERWAGEGRVLYCYLNRTVQHPEGTFTTGSAPEGSDLPVGAVILDKDLYFAIGRIAEELYCYKHIGVKAS